MNLLSRIHGKSVLERRLSVLATHIGSILPEFGTVLDVGCGNGTISRILMEGSPGLEITGIDVMARPSCDIPFEVYDGERFPRPADSVDFVLFTDVLHHVDAPMVLLEEASRVASKAIIIKDHLCDSNFARYILSFMDWVGNRPHGVVLPYNYLTSKQWQDAWQNLDLSPDVLINNLGLYPVLLQPIFEKGLHFICRLPINNQPKS
jgi:SAM-dependent methyltransferase